MEKCQLINSICEPPKRKTKENPLKFPQINRLNPNKRYSTNEPSWLRSPSPIKESYKKSLVNPNRCMSTIRKVFDKMAADLHKKQQELIGLDRSWTIQNWRYLSMLSPKIGTSFKFDPQSKVLKNIFPSQGFSLKVQGRSSPKHQRNSFKYWQHSYTPKDNPVAQFVFKTPKKSISRHKSFIRTEDKLQNLSEYKIKELAIKVYLDWLKLHQQLFGLFPVVPGNFKYYVGKGNNAFLIKIIMKKKWWWTQVDSPSKANFVWTQLKHKSTLQKIKSLPFPNAVKLQDQQKTCMLQSSLIRSKQQFLGFDLILKSGCYQLNQSIQYFDPKELIVHNRIPNNIHICSKKLLFLNLKNYYELAGVDTFSRIPYTLHVKSLTDPTLEIFLDKFKPGYLWIIKPGEKTNRGNGIRVTQDPQVIKSIISTAQKGRTYIIQKYIENPLLIYKRKFDIRCFGLITCLGHSLYGYFYREGYIRTASREFNLKKKSRFIHLTNDAIQKHCQQYGKFEPGNKMSFKEFNKYLKSIHPSKNFYDLLLPQIQSLVTDSIKSVAHLMNPSGNSYTFELFGYDFMVDEELKVWLIQVNTNPCLQLSSAYLATLIPRVLKNSFLIALDPLFPPSSMHKKFCGWKEEDNFQNEFVLVYSSK